MDPTAIQYRLAKKQQPGPEGMWTIRRPDLGMVGSGYIFEVLLENVRDYRRANGLPVGLDFERELECALCGEYKDFPGACVTDDPRAPIQAKSITYREILVGTQVMVSFIKAGRPVVAQEEANRRAAICAACTMNVPYGTPCGGICGELLTLVNRIVDHAKTPSDDQLKACYICGCQLQAAVWMDAEIQTAPLTDYQRQRFEQVKGHCWKAQAIFPAQ